MRSRAFSKLSDNSYDFIRALRDTLPVPLAVFAVMTFSFPVKIFNTLVVDTAKSYFKPGDIYRFLFYNFSYSGNSMIWGFFLVFAGLFTALCAFGFFTRSDSSNVLFSLGLNRSRLFANRTYASLLLLLLGVLVPLTAAFAINISQLDVCGDMVKSFAFLTIAFFTLEVVGFAAGSVIIAFSGNPLEWFAASGLTVLFPVGAIYFAELVGEFMYGFTVKYISADTKLLPKVNLREKLYFIDPITMLFNNRNGSFDAAAVSYTEKYLTQPYYNEYADKTLGDSLSSEAWDVTVAWLVVSILLVLFARRLFSKRRAELSDTMLAGKAIKRVCAVLFFLLFAECFLYTCVFTKLYWLFPVLLAAETILSVAASKIISKRKISFSMKAIKGE